MTVLGLIFQTVYAQQNQPLLVSSPPGRTYAAIRPYTVEEMRQAIPYRLPDSRVTAVIEGYGGSLEYQVGNPGLDAGNLPYQQNQLQDVLPGSSKDASDLLLDETLASTQPYTTGTGYPPPFTRYANFSAYTVYPFRAVGRLFFRPYGSTGVAHCTASSIGGYAVWTAGHCVSDGKGHYHSQWAFVPAYRNGSAPYGQWLGSRAITFNAWHASGNLSRDSAGVILKPLAGLKISEKVGSLGFAWNQNRYLVQWFSIGYPGNIGRGEKQIICVGGLSESDGSKPSPNPVGMGCDMTYGASGGPWIYKFRTGNVLNGNVSFGDLTNKPLEFFSPYFDSSSKTLKDQLVGALP